MFNGLTFGEAKKEDVRKTVTQRKVLVEAIHRQGRMKTGTETGWMQLTRWRVMDISIFGRPTGLFGTLVTR